MKFNFKGCFHDRPQLAGKECAVVDFPATLFISDACIIIINHISNLIQQQLLARFLSCCSNFWHLWLLEKSACVAFFFHMLKMKFSMVFTSQMRTRASEG
jgi:hypothetical protein